MAIWAILKIPFATKSFISGLKNVSSFPSQALHLNPDEDVHQGFQLLLHNLNKPNNQKYCLTMANRLFVENTCELLPVSCTSRKITYIPSACCFRFKGKDPIETDTSRIKYQPLCMYTSKNLHFQGWDMRESWVLRQLRLHSKSWQNKVHQSK